MSFLASKLRHRIQIQKAVQTENDDGGFDQTYETLATVWAGIQPLKGIREYVSIIRGESLANVETHEFIVRHSAVWNLGKQFSKAFSSDFDSIADLEPFKSDMFIFVQQGSTYKGRLFQIVNIKLDEERKEYIKFRALQIEEQGTGYAS